MLGKEVYNTKYEPLVPHCLIPHQAFTQAVLAASCNSVIDLYAFPPQFRTILDPTAPPTFFLPGQEN